MYPNLFPALAVSYDTEDIGRMSLSGRLGRNRRSVQMHAAVFPEGANGQARVLGFRTPM
jgi:hypothetical protein